MLSNGEINKKRESICNCLCACSIIHGPYKIHIHNHNAKMTCNEKGIRLRSIAQREQASEIEAVQFDSVMWLCIIWNYL